MANEDQAGRKATTAERRKPTNLEAYSTIFFLLLTFGLGAAYGLNYVPLRVVVAAYAAIIAKRCGYTWREMEAAVGERIGHSVPVITILLAIGFMLGGLMFSGTLPMVSPMSHSCWMRSMMALSPMPMVLARASV